MNMTLSAHANNRTIYCTELRQAQAVMFGLLLAVKDICEKHAIRYWLDGGTLLGAARHAGFIPWDDDIDIVMPRADYQRFLAIAKYELSPHMEVQTVELDEKYRRYATPCKIRDVYSVIHEADMPVESAKGLFIDVIPLDRFHASGVRYCRDYMLKWVYKRLCAWQHAVHGAPRGLRGRLQNLAVSLRPHLGVEAWLRRYRKWLLERTTTFNEYSEHNYLIGYGFDSYWIRFFRPSDIFPLASLEFEGTAFPVPRNYDSVLRTFYGEWWTLPGEDKRAPPHWELVDIDVRQSGGKAASCRDRVD